MLTIMIISIQMYNPGKQLKESLEVEQSNESFTEKEFEEPDSDSEQETFTMTENPMFQTNPELRQRIHVEETPFLEQVD